MRRLYAGAGSMVTYLRSAASNGGIETIPGTKLTAAPKLDRLTAAKLRLVIRSCAGGNLNVGIDHSNRDVPEPIRLWLRGMGVAGIAGFRREVRVLFGNPSGAYEISTI